MKQVQKGRNFIGRIPHGADMLEFLTNFVNEHEINCAKINCIGAVQKVSLMFYDQNDKQYATTEVDKKLELVHVIGNVSHLEGKRFVHIHGTFSDEHEVCYGGHVGPNTIIFACECIIEEFTDMDGEPFELTRHYDEVTKLSLWEQ
ncbi:hypothetical protein PCE1_002009 [Barthelona sp. PCE]